MVAQNIARDKVFIEAFSFVSFFDWQGFFVSFLLKPIKLWQE